VDTELSPEVRKHKLLWGECIAGALSLGTFEQLALDTGFTFPRIVSARMIEISNEELRAVTGSARFYSVTFRLFKLGPPQLQNETPVPLIAKYTKPMTGYGAEYSLDIVSDILCL